MLNRLIKKEHNSEEGAYKDIYKPISLIICFVCAFVAVWMYMIYCDRVENVYSTYIESELDGFEKSFEAFYIEAKNTAMSIYMDTDIRQVSGGIGLTREDKIKAAKRLRQYKNSGIYTESVCFYDASEQLLYSSEYNLPWAESEYGADTGIFELISEGKTFVMRQRNGKSNRLYTVIAYPFDGKGDAIVINYYYNALANLLGKSSGITIVDYDKKCFASSLVESGTDLSGERYINNIFDSKSDASTLKAKINDKKTIIAYKKTPEFIFINAEQTSYITGKIVAEVVPWLMISMFFLAAVLYILITFGRKMQGQIYKVFESMKYKMQSSESNLNKERFSDFLRNVVFMTEAQVEEAIQSVDFNINTGEPINAVFMKLDHFNTIMKETPLKYRESMRFSVMNVMSELLEEVTGYDMIAMNDNEFVALYNTRTCDEEKIREIIAETQKLFLEKMDISVSAFIGSGALSIHGIQELYKAVAKLSEYGFYEGTGCVLTVDYMKKYSEDKFNDSLEYHIRFANVLKTGSYDKMLIIFEEMVQLLSNSNPSYLRSELLQFAFQIQQMVLKMTDYNTRLTDIYKDIFNDIMCAETLGEVNLIFKELFSYISENIINIKDVKVDSIVNRVTKLVEEQYSDINFSRNVVAEKLSINANYADSLFKKQTSKTIANYIMEYRLEKAKELLKETGYSVNKIAGMVGYSGGSHFIYSFRKRFGITPNEYRKN